MQSLSEVLEKLHKRKRIHFTEGKRRQSHEGGDSEHVSLLALAWLSMGEL